MGRASRAAEQVLIERPVEYPGRQMVAAEVSNSCGKSLDTAKRTGPSRLHGAKLRLIAEIADLGDVRLMKLGFIYIGMLVLSACTRQVEVSAVTPSKDFTGLSDYERKQGSNWVAFDVALPASVARSIRRWQLSNVTLRVFRCDNPDDAYPADARLNGKRLRYEDLSEPLPPSTRLNFYVPQEPANHAAKACAALDARGYSPVALSGPTVRLPPLRMTFPHYDEKTGRITAS